MTLLELYHLKIFSSPSQLSRMEKAALAVCILAHPVRNSALSLLHQTWGGYLGLKLLGVEKTRNNLIIPALNNQSQG